ncbi:hypothetical protein JCM5350_008167 [Sporobolomyces pararoseus]
MPKVKSTKSSSPSSHKSNSAPNGLQAYQDFYDMESAKLKAQNPDVKKIRQKVNAAWKRHKNAQKKGE